MPKIIKHKDAVFVRERKLKDGRISLYLDIYTGGKRSYEPLHLYITNTRATKAEDREKRTIADTIASERLMQIRKGEFYTIINKDITFAEYYTKFIEAHKEAKTHAYIGVFKHISEFADVDTMPLSACNLEWLNELKEYFTKRAMSHRYKKKKIPLSKCSVRLYLLYLKAFINHAVADNLLPASLLRDFDTNIDVNQKGRQYLTIEELKTLAQTPYPHKNDTACRMFLFSCLTGLRRSDILSLKWGMLHKQGDFTRIVINQQKTGGLEYLDLAPQAVDLMGTPGKANDYIFGGISTMTIGKHVKQWVEASGIKKHITFHCARHTFATLMLDLDTDLYTVSKLLGHRDIKTTQIYAKIIDRKKQEAVMKIPQLSLAQSNKKRTKKTKV